MTRPDLSKRERQIMDIIYRLNRATAAAVQENLPSPPSYSAVRALLRILEEKGHLRHRQEGKSYVYMPTLAPEKAKQHAMKNLLKTFFGGSVERAVASLIDMSGHELTGDKLDRLSAMIEEARKEGR